MPTLAISPVGPVSHDCHVIVAFAAVLSANGNVVGGFSAKHSSGARLDDRHDGKLAKPAVAAVAAVVAARAASRKPETVLFASPDDVGCAQIATAWFFLLADPRKATAALGAPRLPVRLDPHLVAAMREVGGDLAAVQARLLTPALLARADLVITMGDSFDRLLLKSEPPLYREHWLIEVGVQVQQRAGYPHHQRRAHSLRDLIRSRVAMLVFTEGWARADIPRDEARVTRPRWHSEASPAF
ncbi:MAG: hypothetical protein ABJA82_01550 [Myxococcales bacterium]